MTAHRTSRHIQILVLATHITRVIALPVLASTDAKVAHAPQPSISSSTTKTGGRNQARNRRNNPPPTEAAAVRLGWAKMPDWANAFHRRGPGNEGNKKYLPPRDGSVDRGMEAIYDMHGNLVTDDLNGGTYNYVAPAYPGDGPFVFVIRGTGHFAVDVLPYLVM